MTRKQLNSAIGEYNLAPQGYKVSKNVIYKVWEEYFVKGYYFYAKNDSVVGLSVTAFIFPLYISRDLHFQYSVDLYHRRKTGVFSSTKILYWDITKENRIETFRKLKVVIEEQGEKEFFGYFNQISDFEKKYSKYANNNISELQALTYLSIIKNERYDTQNVKLLSLIHTAKQWVLDGDAYAEDIISPTQQLLSLGSTSERQATLRTWSEVSLKEILK